MTRKLVLVFCCFLAVGIFAPINNAQTTMFNYQGSLNSGGTPANSNHDFEFALFDALSGGVQLGSTITQNGVVVTNGIFAVSLDFGSQFPGANRFLEIRVRQTGGGGFTMLAPRQPITSAPYAIKSITAENALNLGGVPANQYANSPTGSAGFIQNTATQQANANFNISGNGTVAGALTGNTVNAMTQYNIGTNRVLSVLGFFNTFVGVGAGQSNTDGNSNAFFGSNAGQVNTIGTANSFYGSSVGQANTIGSQNSFFGTDAGYGNTTGTYNSFFGRSSGIANTTANYNSFFGGTAGFSNTSGDYNSFFGAGAGFTNTTGTENAFFGAGTGFANTTASNNSFFGRNAGLNNTTGSSNSFFGRLAGDVNSTGSNNAFFGHDAGGSNTIGTENVFVGFGAGSGNTVGGNNTIIGGNANVGANNLTFATAIGSQSTVSTSNTIALGRSSGTDLVVVYGLGAAGATALCRNASNQISICSSSLRYKTNIGNFNYGLDLVKRLKPIKFEWKDGGMPDLGLGAEDVAAIEPLLVTYNKEGQVEGVKYDRIGVVLVNAMKEQQAQIEAQQKQIERQNAVNKRQQAEIDELKTLVCAQNRQAAVCRK